MSKAVHIPFRDAADAYWHLFVSTVGVARLTQDGTYTDSSGSAIGAAASVTLDQAYDNGATINGAIAVGTAIKLGGAGATDNISLYHDATNMYVVCNKGDLKFSAQGGDFTFDNDNITTTGTIQGGVVTDGTFSVTAGAVTGVTTLSVASATATGNIDVASDTGKLRLGATVATDGYIKFDGAGNNLVFYDATVGSEKTLSQLLGSALTSPTIAGDVTISDGKLTWTDAVDEVAGAWSFAGVANNDITWASSVTSANCLAITANALTTGSMVYLESSVSGFSGEFVRCYDGSADTFVVGKYGAVTIAGNAATDVLTITAGDEKVTAGDVRLSLGIITVDNTADEGSYIKRNHASSTAAVLELEQTNTANAGIGPCLLIDQNSTGNSIGIQIVHNGDYAAIDISADAARTGDAITIATANFLANRAIGISGASTGTSGQGIIEVATTGALAGNLIRLTSATGAPAATSAVAYLSSTGNIAAAIDGAILQIVESGAAQATTYAVNINSTSNEALHVTAGKALFSEAVTVATADAINQDTLTVTQLDATNDKDGIVCAVTGDGYVLKGTVNTATGKGLAMFAAANQTTSLAILDGATENWIGAANVGLLHETTDTAFASVNASAHYIGTSAAINDSRGHCLRIIDSSSVAGTMGYPVAITSADAQMGGVIITTDAAGKALTVVGGTADFAGTVTLSAGAKLLVATTDVTAVAPQNAEIAAGSLGTAASKGAGFMAIIDDNDAHAALFIVVSDGATWHWFGGTKCL